MRTQKWVRVWVLGFIKELPADPWSVFSEKELDRLWGLLPYLKGMTKELLGDNAFNGGDYVKKRRSGDVEYRKEMMVGKRVVIEKAVPTREHLEKVGLSYINRGIFFTCLLYRKVVVDEDLSPNIGKFARAATYGIVIGVDLVQKMRSGRAISTSDAFLRMQRVPRMDFNDLNE